MSKVGDLTEHGSVTLGVLNLTCSDSMNWLRSYYYRLVPINRDFYIIRQATQQQDECGAESALEYQLDYALEHCYQVMSSKV